MINNIVIYHDKCSDGYTSAAIAKSYFKETAEYYPGVYGQSPPDVTDKNVYIIDFSYSLSVFKEVLEKANRVFFIDHHVTALTELKDLIDNHPKLSSLTGITNSGAMLAWMFFYPDKNPPDLVKYVEDRDLWEWKLPSTAEYLMGLELDEFTFEAYCKHLDDSINIKNHTTDMIKSGSIVNTYNSNLVKTILDSHYYTDFYVYKNIPIVNCTTKFSSLVGASLCKKYPNLFSIMYTIEKDIVSISFRSTDLGIDVGTIAKQLGGGGHRNASGAKLTLKQFYDLFKIIN